MSEQLSRDVLKAAFAASRLLNERPPRIDASWEILSPYLHLEDLPGESEHRNIALCMLNSIAADCLREGKQYERAAAYYARASQYPGFYGHAGYFAELVIAHGQNQYLEIATKALRESRHWWACKPIWYKALGHTIFWLRYGLWRADIRAALREQRRCEKQLLVEAEARGL